MTNIWHTARIGMPISKVAEQMKMMYSPNDTNMLGKKVIQVLVSVVRPKTFQVLV